MAALFIRSPRFKGAWSASIQVMRSTEATMCPTDAATDRFIHVENLILLGRQFAEETNVAKRQQILTLLNEEKAKGYLPTEK